MRRVTGSICKRLAVGLRTGGRNGRLSFYTLRNVGRQQPAGNSVGGAVGSKPGVRREKSDVRGRQRTARGARGGGSVRLSGGQPQGGENRASGDRHIQH